MAKLRADDRADACQLHIERFLYRRGRVADQFRKFRLRYGERVFFLHGLRDKIGPSGQNLTNGADLGRNMLDAVENHVFVIAEDNIAVLAHDLNIEFLDPLVPQFVEMLNLHADDSLQPRLADPHDTAVSNMLS